MRIAYLISAHCDPHHLERLVHTLNENAEFFIHIDAKSDFSAFSRLDKVPQVHFLKERVHTLWGDITQVYYQIALLRACLESGTVFDRICTLSGLDYPLVSNRKLQEFFSAYPDREFIQGINLSIQREEVTRNYRIYRPQLFFPLLNDRTNSRLRILVRKLFYALGLRKKLTFQAGGHTYPVYKGSDWWAITPQLGRYLLQQLELYPEIMRYFATSFAPSELIWQSMVFNSPFAEKAMLFDRPYVSLASLTPLHYIYYEPVIKILTEKDYPALMASGKLFCRKTCTGTSDALMNLIDRQRNSNSSSFYE